jgi:alkanesulfonate monooxygenase SsuD/methylene tetrahydromethanopterin reductase-like flavin-dependent oxidoreductase (luciferase family)
VVERGIAIIRSTSLACAVALLFLVGCSDDSNDSASTTSTVTGAAAPPTTLQPVNTAFTGQGSAEFCTLAKSYNDQSKSVGSAPQTPAAVQEGRRAINEAVTAAPAEIKGDVQVIAAAFTSVADAFEKANYDPAKLDVSSLQKLQTPEFQASTARFQAYLRDVCKVSG